MIDYIDANIEHLSVHRIGNRTNEEPLVLSKTGINLSDDTLKELLLRFFMQSFTTPEFYAFTFSNGDFSLNPIFSFCTKIFENDDTLHQNSVNIAKLLYELSIHPQIKQGELFLAYFTDVTINDEVAEVIGIFKSENKQSFLKPINNREDFKMLYDSGINIDKIDKGCLIFNLEAETGYKICVIDKGGKSEEAQYWKESFMQIKPRNDAYYNTKQAMSIAKNFIVEQIATEYAVTKADQIDLLNRSATYFQNNETYNKQHFEQEIFKESNLIKSYQDFEASYKEANELQVADEFGISAPAVKKQAKIFKNVLKLDKNFHIYIHGDKELIEQGKETDGRKFYKIYYQEES